jgi:metallo-beta-lactamase family protein
LLNWLKGFKYKPKKVFIVHGEANAKEEFAKEAEHTLNMKCIVPQYETIYDIKAEDELEEINVFDSVYSDGAVVLNKEKKIIKLTEDVEKLRKLFDDALKLTQNHLNNENIKKESLIKINNNILELENEILNLTILSGK